MNHSHIHERSIQTLEIELYKVTWGLSPEIMKLVFPLNPKKTFVWEDIFQTFNVKTTSLGLETLAHIGPKIWSNIPRDMKKLYLYQNLLNQLENGSLYVPVECVRSGYITFPTIVFVFGTSSFVSQFTVHF